MKSIKDLYGLEIEHRSLGLIEVVEITDEDQGKFVGRLKLSGEIKKFILNSRFFNNVEDYQTKEIKINKKIDKTRKYKKVDLDKYRKHPLVKEIDSKESKRSTPSID
jgi:hypothetical protein